MVRRKPGATRPRLVDMHLCRDSVLPHRSVTGDAVLGRDRRVFGGMEEELRGRFSRDLLLIGVVFHQLGGRFLTSQIAPGARVGVRNRECDHRAGDNQIIRTAPLALNRIRRGGLTPARMSSGGGGQVTVG